MLERARFQGYDYSGGLRPGSPFFAALEAAALDNLQRGLPPLPLRLPPTLVVGQAAINGGDGASEPLWLWSDVSAGGGLRTMRRALGSVESVLEFLVGAHCAHAYATTPLRTDDVPPATEGDGGNGSGSGGGDGGGGRDGGVMKGVGGGGAPTPSSAGHGLGGMASVTPRGGAAGGATEAAPPTETAAAKLTESSARSHRDFAGAATWAEEEARRSLLDSVSARCHPRTTLVGYRYPCPFLSPPP